MYKNVKVSFKLRGQLLRNGNQRNSYVTYRLDLMYIPLKFHEDNPNDYRVIGRTIFFLGKIIKEA